MAKLNRCNVQWKCGKNKQNIQKTWQNCQKIVRALEQQDFLCVTLLTFFPYYFGVVGLVGYEKLWKSILFKDHVLVSHKFSFFIVLIKLCTTSDKFEPFFSESASSDTNSLSYHKHRSIFALLRIIIHFWKKTKPGGHVVLILCISFQANIFIFG